jgi:hypothetical protein
MFQIAHIAHSLMPQIPSIWVNLKTIYVFYGSMVGLTILGNLKERNNYCQTDEDCFYLLKCCINYCCSLDEYKENLIPEYVMNKYE